MRQPERSFDAMGRMAPPILNEFLSQDLYLFETPTLYRRRILFDACCWVRTNKLRLVITVVSIFCSCSRVHEGASMKSQIYPAAWQSGTQKSFFHLHENLAAFRKQCIDPLRFFCSCRV